MNTVVGIFNNGIDVERAIFDLEQRGFHHISVLDHECEQANPPARWFGIDDRTIDVDAMRQDISVLQEMGVPDAAAYAARIQRGYKLVVVWSEVERVRELLDVLCEANAVNLATT
jgi:hypothetical protein